ncbi:hypothetical protein [Ralstonia pseudosolanacearum]|uniref:hypothetical protein n=1 Tax=Ralstonia pseudosolanacearum TaxID=1310165 RepID=UPI0008DA0C5A|nr:hypothetical protein [Ralstonia pseudosolanacearum]MCL1621619.1 hypothetical protein [Ralstonia pseudosolanacearum CaRs-Mep]MCQ4682708.1 hypothetical protein [Ralstonia pseudosolanacearum]
MDYWNISIPLMLLGSGHPFFFVPLNALALGSVEESKTASAAGLMNFLRTLSGAVATSLVMAAWQNRTTLNHAELVGMNGVGGALRPVFSADGLASDTSLQYIDRLVGSQSLMLATNQVMAAIVVFFLVAATATWLAPKHARQIDPTAMGH